MSNSRPGATAGGRAANAGADYHANVGAVIFASIIAESPIAWFARQDIPTAVSMETGGPGDDLQIEFGLAPTSGEVQAKHSIDAAAGFTALIEGIETRTGNATPTPVALVAGRRSTRAIFTEVRLGLERLRDGQLDRIGAIVRREFDAGHRRILEKLYVVEVNVDDAASVDRKAALELLMRRLADPGQAEQAWGILVTEALALAAAGGRRDAPALTDLLERAGVRLKPLDRDAPWLSRLDFITKELFELALLPQALSAYAKLNAELDGADASARTRARARRMLAVCLLAMDRVESAQEPARRAVEHDPDWSDGHAAYGQVLAANGQRELAIRHADRAIELGPTNPKAWAAKVRVADSFGLPPPDVPPVVSAHRDFKNWVIGFHREHGNWAEVLAVSATLLGEGEPPLNARFFHAEALIVPLERARGDLSDARQAEAELTALIATLEDEQPVLAPAIQLRSRARWLLGDEAGALEDERRAEEINRDDPAIVQAIANARALRGDLTLALQTLQTRAVASEPRLLAIRAGLLVAAGRNDDARRDIAAALQAIEERTDPDDDLDGALYPLGSVAVDLGDLALARDLLARMSADGRKTSLSELLAGEIAFGEGAVDAGVERYLSSAALEEDPGRSLLLTVQLAMRLLDLGQAERAMAVLRPIPLDDIARLPEQALRAYAVAALRSGDLPAAQAAVDKAAEAGPLAPWALSIRVDLGLRREDPAGVVADGLAIEAQGATTARINLTMTIALIELGRKHEARDRVRIALAGAMTPMERAEAAGYLQALGETGEAIDQAFRAFREDRGNPTIQRVVASLVFTSRFEIPKPETVAAGTHVVLVRGDGQTREHSVFADAPLEKAAGDLTVEEAAAAGFLGLRVGDSVPDPHAVAGERWEVRELLPAVVKAAQRIAATFDDNFPTEPFFMKAFRVGDGSGLADFAPIISMGEDRRERVTAAIQLYHDQVLPLGYLESLTGGGVDMVELMDAASLDRVLRPLLVESADAQGYRAAIQLALEAPVVILTRSGLFTARRFSLLEILHGRYELVAPTSLLWRLRQEAETKTAVARAGRDTLMTGESGISIVRVAANDPTLLAAAEDAQEALDWVEGHAQLLPRPLTGPALDETARNRELEREETRREMGPHSFDASVLGEQGHGALYTDDLGMRRWNTGTGRSPAGFSTITLVEALAEDGTIDGARASAMKVDLLLAGYVFVRPSVDVLEEAVRRMPDLGRERLESVFACLGSQLATPIEAAQIVVELIVRATAQRLELVPLELLTESGIAAVAGRAPRPAVARAIKRACEVALALNPIAMRRIARVCDRLAVEEPPTLGA